MVGIVQEQHGERARLFMQWKQMDWPILVDALDLLEVTAVPITVLIDGHGIVQKVRAKPDDLETFLKECEKDGRASGVAQRQETTVPNIATLRMTAESNDSSESWREYGDALFLWEGEPKLDEAIDVYDKALALDPDDGITHFHKGVALRRRFETEYSRPNDFAEAITHWERALSINPNQYIWRRRIQQYGPRLDKPYSFYDWINQARDEINARGETPHPLTVEPRGAEFANPSREFTTDKDEAVHPDPEHKIDVDESFISVQTSIVRATPGREPRVDVTARVHLIFTPNSELRAHWNNEAEPMEVWLKVPDGWSVNHERLGFDNPHTATSSETRTVEFEIQGPADALPATFGVSAFYNVCEDVDGQCLYRRKDLEITLK